MPKRLKQKIINRKVKDSAGLKNMKKLNMKNLILVSVFAFLSLGFAFETFGQTKQIIVNVTGARVRSAPNLNGKVLGSTKMGTVYTSLAAKGDWHNITFGKNVNGWISGTVVENFDKARRGAIYQNMAAKYFKREKLDFNTAAELFDFLTGIQTEIAGTSVEADLSLKRFIALAAALEAIPFEKVNEKLYTDFTKANEAEVVYSEPAGQYLVIADKIWDLREKYASLPIAEEIAWRAAQTYLPGECEGYVICTLYNIRETEGKYLEFYPNGRNSGEAMENLANYLEGIADGADGKEFSGYYITSEDSTQLDKYVSELREIVSKSANPLRAKILGFLDRIARFEPKDEDNQETEGLDEFWGNFRMAVIKNERNMVAEMTKFPLAMPFGQQSVKNKADFLKRYNDIFSNETDAAKCFETAELVKTGGFGVYCGFKSALDDENNKPIYYYFEKTEAGWKFVGLDNINE